LRAHEKRKQIEVMMEYLMKTDAFDKDDTAKVKDIILWS
jgi:hypothetical protein